MQNIPNAMTVNRLRDFFIAGNIASFCVMPFFSNGYQLFAVFKDGSLISVNTFRGSVKSYSSIDSCLSELVRICGAEVPFQYRPA
jgi:hypothetical protein